MAVKEHLLERISEIDPKFRELALLLIQAIDDGKSSQYIEEQLFSEINEYIDEEYDI